MSTKKIVAWPLSGLAVVAFTGTATAQGPAGLYQKTTYTGKEIGKLTGDVYYARWDDYLSAFMVTPEAWCSSSPSVWSSRLGSKARSPRASRCL